MKNQSTSQHVLSFDLLGPHLAACGLGDVYALVGVYYVEQPGENIPFVRGLKRKTAEEVSKALKSIFAEIRCIFGENIVLRAHSDAGGDALKCFALAIIQFSTEGNGTNNSHITMTIPPMM